MVKFSTARKRALVSLYMFTASRRLQLHADIGEHAIGLALSERRPDAYLARSAIRNARCTQLRQLRREARIRVEVPPDPDGTDAAFDAVMAQDGVSVSARPPSIERTLLIRDSLNMLLDEVEAELGEMGRIVAQRYQDEVAEVATALRCGEWRVKELRAGVRRIADRLASEVRP